MMLRSTVRPLQRCLLSPSVTNSGRLMSSKGPLGADVKTDAHPTIKDKEEKVLAKARDVARNVRSGIQSPNREVVWSEHQQPRQDAWKGPRFEQTDFELQPRPQAAIELIAQQPIRYEERRVVSCDGGGGALGHPRVYINLDKTGEPNVCGYCEQFQGMQSSQLTSVGGTRFQMAPHHTDHLESVGGN